MDPSANVGEPAGRELRRKLAVILASDVAAYSALVAADEEDTIARFRAAAAAFAARVQRHRGRIFNTAGDAILAEFESAVDATRCALDIQDGNNAANATVDGARRLLFRIGIAVGDVLVSDNGDLLGDGVNIAARLEGIAEPGGICIAEDVRVHVSGKIGSEFVDLGEQKLKNIPRGIRAYRLGSPASRDPPKPVIVRALAPRKLLAWTAAAAVVLAGMAVLLVHNVLPPSPMTPVAGINRAFDAASVPLVTDRVRSSFADYGQQPDFRAIAISHIGWGVASGLADAVGAERDALDRCKKRDPKGDCRIYAVGNEVVWPQLPLPLPADLHADPLDIPLQATDIAVVKGMPSAAGLTTYLSENNHKALAIAESGFSSMANRSDAGEAVRLAVERCSDFAKSPCLLVSLDGSLTVRIPHSYGIVRPYTLAGDTEMTEPDKAQIALIYAGKDWRALARGGSGHWYAVGAAGSEMGAAEQALAKCRQADAQCQLRAVGNFRVDRQ